MESLSFPFPTAIFGKSLLSEISFSGISYRVKEVTK